MFQSFNGLPVHPLVVHAAVVFIPLTLLGIILISVKRSWRKSLGWWVVLLAFASLVSPWRPRNRASVWRCGLGCRNNMPELGDTLPIFAGLMFLAVLALVLADRYTTYRAESKAAAAVGRDRWLDGEPRTSVRCSSRCWRSSRFSLASWRPSRAYRVGDAGAKAVWASVLAKSSSSTTGEGTSPTPSASTSSGATSSASPSSSASASGTGSPSASPSGTTASYTLAQVKTHNTAADCWTAVDGKVYNVTKWEDQHPGGSANIISMCGTDGTAAFKGQHDSKPRPNNELANFQIGVLAS